MSNDAFTQLYYHIVWTTKDRVPQIKEALLQYVQHVVTESATKRHASVIACGVMPEHVHLLVRLLPTTTVATFIGQVKGSVSYEINRTIGEQTVRWQVGYGALTLRAADLEKVARYVNNQPAIHARRVKPSILEVTESPDDGA